MDSMEQVELFEAKLLMLMRDHAKAGMDHDQLMFAFARSAFRMALAMMPETYELPPDRSYWMTITAMSDCGCLLDVKMGECERPEGYTTAHDHDEPN
jgi:hypothetical protein